MKNKNYIITRYVSVLLFSTMAFTHAEERKTADMIQAISKTTKVVDKVLLITMKNKGERYLFSVDNSKPRITDYQEVIQLKAGFEKAVFISRHYTLTVTAIKDSPSKYTIKEVIDTRSVGGEIKHNTKSFIITENKLQDAPSE